MKKTHNYGLDIAKSIKEMAKKYEGQRISTHLAIALSDYTDFDGISDKELWIALEKYMLEKDLDMLIPHDEDLDKIIKEGQNLDIDALYEDEEDF